MWVSEDPCGFKTFISQAVKAITASFGTNNVYIMNRSSGFWVKCKPDINMCEGHSYVMMMPVDPVCLDNAEFAAPSIAS